jgi:flagellar basal-body rod protein FlgG
MRALSDRIGVITQNIANAQTTAFKRRRVDANSGLDAKLSDLPLDMTQGSLESTGINTDVAISGEGFLHVKVFPSSGDGTGYTRNGTLFKNAVGDLIVGIGGGYRLIPTINILIGQDGTVSYLAAGKNSRVRAGQIHISRFTNPQALSPLGGGIYSATALSGPVVSCIPGQSGAGVLMNGFLESSNVDPIRESVDLVEAEQSLQLSGQALETAIRARQTIAALDRR